MEYKKCSRCKKKTNLTMFFKNCLARDGLTPECKKCNYLKTKNWRERNWNKFLKTSRRLARLYRKNGDLLDRNRQYKLKNIDRVREVGKRRRKEIKFKIMSHYSKGKPKCNCCGESNIDFLSVDHINNEGALHRKEVGGGQSLYYWIIRNKYPKKKFQILCFNCNNGKRFYSICPHKIKNL